MLHKLTSQWWKFTINIRNSVKAPKLSESIKITHEWSATSISAQVKHNLCSSRCHSARPEVLNGNYSISLSIYLSLLSFSLHLHIHARARMKYWNCLLLTYFDNNMNIQVVFYCFPENSSFCGSITASGTSICQAITAHFYPAVQHTLLHTSIFKCWPPVYKQASHHLKIFLNRMGIILTSEQFIFQNCLSVSAKKWGLLIWTLQGFLTNNNCKCRYPWRQNPPVIISSPNTRCTANIYNAVLATTLIFKKWPYILYFVNSLKYDVRIKWM
jgi:hypothetical protein